jgi:hypothetical protein
MQNESIFSEHGLTTIFEGELVPQLRRDGTVEHYRVRGFRYEDPEQMMLHECSIIESSRRVPDGKGVYRAGVTVRGVNRDVSKSNFFPQSMTRAEVVQSIIEAFDTKEQLQMSERLYAGKSANLTILLWLDENNHIVDAMPKAAQHQNKVKQAIFHHQQTGKRSKLLCHVCLQPKVLVCPEGHTNPRRSIYKRIIRGVSGWLKQLKRSRKNVRTI